MTYPDVVTEAETALVLAPAPRARLFMVETWDLDGPAALMANGLQAQIVRAFGWHDLGHLHEWPYLGELTLDPMRAEDQKTRAHRQFYAKFPRFAELYALLATWSGFVLFGELPFLIQAVPTFRVHFPHSRAVGEAHRDLWYGHQPGEITCWLPFTDAANTDAVWIQSDELVPDHPFAFADDRVALCPAPVRRGQLLVFDSVNLLHANRLNREDLAPVTELDYYGAETIVEWAGRGRTRVSIDYRILPAHLHDPRTRRRAVNTGTPMVLGGYWAPPVPELLDLLRDQARLDRSSTGPVVTR